MTHPQGPINPDDAFRDPSVRRAPEADFSWAAIGAADTTQNVPQAPTPNTHNMITPPSRHPSRRAIVAMLAIGGGALSVAALVGMRGSTETSTPPVADELPEEEPATGFTPDTSASPEAIERPRHPFARFPAPSNRMNLQPSSVLKRSWNPSVRAAGEIVEQTTSNEPFMDGIMMAPTQAGKISEVRIDPDDPIGWIPAAIRDFKEAGIVNDGGFANAITVMQPGLNSLYTQFDSEQANDVLRTFYFALKEAGVTGADLGTVAVVPEPTVGGWKGAQDEAVISRFAAMVNNQTKVLMEVFPDASPSIMLDMKDINKVLPYLDKIDTSRVASVGFQAFDGKPGQGNQFEFASVDGKIVVTNIEKVMPYDKIIETIGALGSDLPVWFNVGMGDTTDSIEEREAIITAITDQILHVQDTTMSDRYDSTASNEIVVKLVNMYFADRSKAAQKRNFAPNSPRVANAAAAASTRLANKGIATSVAASAA